MLAGDAERFRELVRRYQGPVFAVLRSFLGNATLVEDLAQETFLTALERLDQFDPSRGAFRPWLLMIARNKCRDALRRQRRTPVSYAFEIPPSSGACAASDAAIDKALDRALGRLSPDHRLAFLLTQIYGVSVSEVAELEGVAEGTVRSRCARARIALRESLQVLEEPRKTG